MLNGISVVLRRLIKAPGFTATAVATLALCIGANLAIFAVVDAVLIRSLPFPRADRLLTLYFTYPNLPSVPNGASLTNYYERRGKVPGLASLSTIDESSSVVGESGATSIEKMGRVTSEFFDTLGVAPFMGRTFRDAEMTYQTDHVAIIGYEYWRSVYGSDPNILGKTIRMDGTPRVIVGVLPRDFRFLSFQAPVYMPLSSEEGERNVSARHNVNKIEIGRLADGAKTADVVAQVNALDAVLAPTFPLAKIVADAGCHTVVAPLQADYVASVRPVLVLLQAGALFLLVIGCVNLVNLLLVRASSRTRELAIRQALGASRGRVVKDVITETLVLTVAGALLGLLVGAAGVRLISAYGADQLPLGALIQFNERLAEVALVGALVAGIAIGIPVAWFNLHHRLAGALQSETRGGTASRATQRLRHAFIVTQIALAFVLLTGAGLLGLSLRSVMAVAPGFRPDHVITGRFNLTWAGYHDINSFYSFYDRMFEKTRSLPGVSAIGAISDIPMTNPSSGDVIVVPGYTPRPGDKLVVHGEFAVAGDYFKAMGLPLLEGRFLASADDRNPLHPCVVDSEFARHYWPDGGALGKQIYRGDSISKGEKPFVIVGVVGSVKQISLTDESPRGAVYYPYSQLFKRDFFLVARTSQAPESIAPSIARVIREVDPDEPLTDIRSMDARIFDSLAPRRSPALMAAVFAAAALLLAAIGLYGVMAYSVAQRSREFGVRMALGAQRTDVLGLVLGEGVRLAGLGLGVGLLGSLLLTGFMSSLLFGVKPGDPLAYAGVALVLGLVSCAAVLLPASRATKVDPMVALRSE